MAAPEPTKDFLSGFFEMFTRYVAQMRGGATKDSFNIYMQPTGNYAGHKSQVISRDNPIITNPWGVAAGTGNRFGSGPVLAPGQSYNFITGQLSDPKLHTLTAQRLNDATNLRAASEAGLTAANRDSARQSQSVLGTLDQMYFGNQASVNVNASLSGIQQAAQGGLDSSTILGSRAVARKQGRG